MPRSEGVEWIEARSGGVLLHRDSAAEQHAAERQPDRSTMWRAWAIYVATMEGFVAILNEWSTDLAASLEVFVRDRGRHVDGRDLVVVLEDFEAEHLPACVVEQRRALRP